jgi:hypothetical protein
VVEFATPGKIYTESCYHLNRATGRLIARNGAIQIKDYCTDCGKILSGAKKAARILRHTLPLIRDNREAAQPCDHCGQTTGVERHHWAPRALFNDSDEWPTAELCQPCHRLWHKSVTPKMRRTEAA